MDTDQYRIYVIEGAEQLALLATFDADRQSKMKAQRKWCRARGATGCMVGNKVYAVIVPRRNPGPDGWRRHPDQCGVPMDSVAWSPMPKTAEGRRLIKELRGLLIPGGTDAAEAIGVTDLALRPFGNGMTLVRSLCVQVGSAWLLLHPKGVKERPLVGCRRIKASEFCAMQEAADAAKPRPARA